MTCISLTLTVLHGGVSVHRVETTLTVRSCSVVTTVDTCPRHCVTCVRVVVTLAAVTRSGDSDMGVSIVEHVTPG